MLRQTAGGGQAHGGSTLPHADRTLKRDAVLACIHTPPSLSLPAVATPHVSGAAALYAAWHLSTTGTMPTAAAIKAAILASAEPTPSLDGKCVSNGRLNVARLLNLEP